MNKNKKIFFIFLTAIIVLVAIILIIINKGDDGMGPQNVEEVPIKSFIEKTTFIERENIIKNLLMEKHGVDSGLEIFIARETERHINGVFFIENIDNNELFQGKFFATADKSINIVWSGSDSVDCSVINRYGFPPEMAQECF